MHSFEYIETQFEKRNKTNQRNEDLGTIYTWGDTRHGQFNWVALLETKSPYNAPTSTLSEQSPDSGCLELDLALNRQ